MPIALNSELAPLALCPGSPHLRLRSCAQRAVGALRDRTGGRGRHFPAVPARGHRLVTPGQGGAGLAVSAAERWGRILEPVVVTIHPTHQALEAAAHREGFPWLRAWARRASVDLQSPRTWSRGRASDAAMTQILAHELTHCVMYQWSALDRSRLNRGIPLWFREGMASVTAGQELRPKSSDAGRRSQEKKGDPLAAPEALLKSDSARSTPQRTGPFTSCSRATARSASGVSLPAWEMAASSPRPSSWPSGSPSRTSRAISSATHRGTAS